jgi:hypothetical protein
MRRSVAGGWNRRERRLHGTVRIYYNRRFKEL